MGITTMTNITYLIINYSKKITINVKFDEMNVPKRFAQHIIRNQYRLIQIQNCLEIINLCIKSRISYWTIHCQEITKKEKVMM